MRVRTENTVAFTVLYASVLVYVPFVMLLLTYVVGAFTSGTWDTGAWTQGSRGWAVVVWLLLTAVVDLLVIHATDGLVDDLRKSLDRAEKLEKQA